jgi:phosphatidylglycerol---prolipoprotein diacylglyceryl transferase
MLIQFINWNVKPEIFTLGPLTLRWYGLLFVTAFIFGIIVFKKIFSKEGFSMELLDELTIYIALGTVIGARLGHVLFYSPGYYFENPVRILKIWEGGLASHGGAIGILLALYLFVKKNKLEYLWILDRIGIVVALGGVFIRLGNLMNSEIYGIPTSLPWGFIFNNSSEVLSGKEKAVPCHPTQIYEAISYLIIFIFLYNCYNKNRFIQKRGILFGVFLILLFGARFLIEFIKNPQENFEKFLPINMGQILSLPFILAGIIFIMYASRKPSKAKNKNQINGFN